MIRLMQLMELSLYITYLLPIVIFGPLYFLYYKKSDNLSETLKLIILGGFGWALLAIITLIPFSFILESSTEKRYLEMFDTSGDNNRTPLFWIVLFTALISEIIKFRFVRTEGKWLSNYKSLAIMGLFWGLFEFLSRFLFFFDHPGDNLNYIVFLFFYVCALNIGLSLIILRTEENTKFVMFSAIMRFFSELSVFGAFGHVLDDGTRISRLFYVIITHIFIVYLSVITRKPIQVTSNES